MVCFNDGDIPKDKICAAALNLFSQKGFSDTTVQEIADVAGVNKSMLFYYFHSKENLFLSVLKQNIKDIKNYISNSISEKCLPDENLANIIDVLIIMYLDMTHLKLIKIMIQEMGSPMPGVEAYIREEVTGIIKILADVISEGVEQKIFRPVDSQMTALSIIGIIHFFSKIKIDSGNIIEESKVRGMFKSLYTEGLKL